MVSYALALYQCQWWVPSAPAALMCGQDKLGHSVSSDAYRPSEGTTTQWDPLALLLLWHSHITAAVPLLRCCCCAALALLLPYRSRLGPAACGALASLLLYVALSIAPLRLLWHSSYPAPLLPWRSRITAAMPLSLGCCCGARASLLLWRSRITACMLLWHSSQLILLLCCCCCGALASLLLCQPLSLGCCMLCMALSHRCCRAALASLRLRCSPLGPLLLLYTWRSRIAAASALPLSLG